MEKKGNDSLREELRSSQVYNVLKGSGIPVAGKIADGLDKATQGLGQVVDGFASGVRSGTSGNPSGHPYQEPPRQGNYRRPPQQGAPQNGWAQRNPPPNGANYQAPRNPSQYNPGQTGNGYYHYSYVKGNQAQPPQPPRQQTRQQVPPAPQGQTRQTRPPQPPVYKQPRGNAPQQGAPAPGVPMKMVRKGSPAKFYITGAAALIYALSAPLYEPHHFVIFAAVLVLVFLASGALFRGKKMFVPIEPEKPKEEPKLQKEEKSQTGNPEVDKIIDEGREYLKKLRAADDAIPDEALSECITRMERASKDIFRFIADHPEKAPQIRKFMNYYLPTTLKLLNSYQRLSSQSVKGENITSTMFNIAGMMHTVADAFEKQLDSLFSEEAMDISADITVFETLLKQEGFVDEEKKEETK